MWRINLQLLLRFQPPHVNATHIHANYCRWSVGFHCLVGKINDLNMHWNKKRILKINCKAPRNCELMVYNNRITWLYSNRMPNNRKSLFIYGGLCWFFFLKLILDPVPAHISWWLHFTYSLYITHLISHTQQLLCQPYHNACAQCIWILFNE